MCSDFILHKSEQGKTEDINSRSGVIHWIVFYFAESSPLKSGCHKTNNNSNKTSFTAAHNDSATTRKRSGIASSVGSRVIGFAESIVHPETAAVSDNEDMIIEINIV